MAGMRWLLSTYTIRLNHRHKLLGHVFSGRYKALLVEGGGQGYLDGVRLRASEPGAGENAGPGRAEFERRMEARRCPEMDEAECEPLGRGWCLGSEAFRKQMLERMEGQLGESHAGELRRESAEVRAERIIAEELGRLGWSEAQLREWRKSDAAKLALAARLRRETTLTVGWIANRLHLGTRKSAAVKLHRLSNSRGLSKQSG